MNAMLASGGYPWTVVRVEDRAAYLAALDRASIDGDRYICDFSRRSSAMVARPGGVPRSESELARADTSPIDVWHRLFARVNLVIQRARPKTPHSGGTLIAAPRQHPAKFCDVAKI